MVEDLPDGDVRMGGSFKTAISRLGTGGWNVFFKRLRSISNFSLRYQYSVKQTGDENKGNHQEGMLVHRRLFCQVALTIRRCELL